MTSGHTSKPDASLERSRANRPGRAMTVVLGLALVPALVWAVWPLRSVTPPISHAMDAAPTSSAATVAFDSGAFTTPLWVAPPASPGPPAPEPQPAPPSPLPPLKMQLLSILREPGGNRAMLYDPDTRKIQTLAVGDHVGATSDGHAITSITDRTVEISGPRGVQTLSLRKPAAPANSTTPTTTTTKSGRKR